MKKNIFNVALLLLLALVAGACSDSDTTKTVDNGRRSGAATQLAVLDNAENEISALNFTLGAGNYIIGINCDGDWTATVDADWITLSNYAGYGFTNKNSYTKISVTKNDGDTRVGTVTIKSGSISRTVTVTQKGSAVDPGDTFMSAFEFVETFKMGYNLGNTLDCNPDITDPNTASWFKPTSDLDWETVWGQPVTTQEIINAIAEKGFNAIRVPVTWYPHMDAEGNVNEVWMARVQEVVDYVLNAGCYCILNVQHDSGTRGGRTDGAGWLQASESEYDATSVKFKKLWTQIATRFKDYGDHLLFEAFNEILDNSDNWNDPSDASAYTAITKLEQDFVDAVRATGGNNEFRNLVVNPYSAGTSAAKLAGFQCPNDIHPSHLLASVHSYDPYWFCNDSDDSSAQDYYITMFDSSCQSEIDGICQRIETRFLNELGMPYFFGEFGAIGTHPQMGERVKYAKYMKQKFNQYNIAGLWWMGLYDRKTGEWYEDDIATALFQ